MSARVHYVFAAGHTLEPDSLEDLYAFYTAYETSEAVNIQDVVLNDEAQLALLLRLLGLSLPPAQVLNDSEDFSAFYDLSSQQLPVLSEEAYNTFYSQWLAASGRKNAMDEYGQLIFLQGQAARWNQFPHRLILQARWEAIWPDHL